MKGWFFNEKIIVIMSIFLMISVLNQKDYNFDDMIKFRIISNSNSPKDIIIKQQVSDKVSKSYLIKVTQEKM